MIRAIKLLISGRVQGVFFRQATKNKAIEYGVFGMVRNLDDGRVEIIAQAGTISLEAFIEWCHKGPIAARVDRVETVELDVNELRFTAFEIK